MKPSVVEGHSGKRKPTRVEPQPIVKASIGPMEAIAEGTDV